MTTKAEHKHYIMKKERQVCTYDQAVKFKELGLEQRTLFCYNHPKESYIPNWKEESAYKIKVISGDVYDGWSGYEYYAAYTVAEMMHALRGFMPYWIAIWGEWGYRGNDGQGKGYGTIAEACGWRLLECIESKQLTIEEVNKRILAA